MESKAIILVVDDEKAIRNYIVKAVESQGYRCIQAENATEAISQFYAYQPDMIILDLGLPDKDGIEVVREVRENSATPIIIVSAKGQEIDKIDALDAGANDYLTKPFGIGELLARVRVGLRSVEVNKEKREEKTCIAYHNFVVDIEKRVVTVNGKVEHFTPIEYKLLLLFCENIGKVLTYHFILKTVWNSYSHDEIAILRVFVNNLRKKIEEDPTNPKLFLTEVGIGYRLSEEIH